MIWGASPRLLCPGFAVPVISYARRFFTPAVDPGACGGGALAGFSAGVLCKYPPAVFSVSESVVCAGWGTCTPLNTSDILNLYRV